MGWAIEDSRLQVGGVDRLWTSGDSLLLFRDIFQPVFDLVEEGEGLWEEGSETKGREDTVEIEEALMDMVVMVVDGKS